MKVKVYLNKKRAWVKLNKNDRSKIVAHVYREIGGSLMSLREFSVIAANIKDDEPMMTSVKIRKEQMYEEISAADIIRKGSIDGLYYFYDETWTIMSRPYFSKVACRTAYERNVC